MIKSNENGRECMSDLQRSSTFVDVGEHGLKKHDVKVHTVVFMIFCLVAAGCYGIEEMIPESGPGLTLIMLMVLPFVWGLPFGLVASELGSVRPQEGGYYKWVQEAFGEFWGFQAGWWRTISVYIDNTLYVILAGSYMAAQWGLSQGWEMFFKVLMVLVFTYINVRGVKDVGVVSTVLSILVITAFAMVAICGFLNWNGNPFEPFTAGGAAADQGFADWIYYIGMGIAIGVWMYSGYESMSTFAGELENPQVISRATLIAVPIIMCTYIFPTMGGLAAIGNWEDWGTEPGAVGYATVPMEFWGPAFGTFFTVIAVLANCSIYNTYITSGSRGFFALADDKLAPPIMVRCDKKRGVPFISVLSVGFVNIILCQFAFKQVIILDVFLLVSSYILVYLTALKLRREIPKEEYRFLVPGGYGFLAVICIVPIFIAFMVFFINGADYFMGGMIGIVSGPVVYFIWKKMYGGLAKKDPVRFPVNKKTGLAVGDTKKIAGMFLGFAIVGFLAIPWLNWFEGDWGPGYEVAPNEIGWSEIEILSEFGDLSEELSYKVEEEGNVWIPGYYEMEYGKGLLSNFDAMLNVILVLSIIFVALFVIFAVIAWRVEPKKAG